jgi:hypothetical protein
MNEANVKQETEFVFRRLTEALNLGGRELDARLWLAVLIPVLIAAFVYVIWMYKRDSRSVGWAWATFLGALRGGVYLLLALVFLLPALQTWEKTETHSKVVLLLDVTGSMNNKDEPPSDTLPLEKILSRKDKVVRFLSDDQVAFLRRLMDKNPVTVYRFGGVVDEDAKILDGAEGLLTPQEWAAWLTPDTKLAIPLNVDKEEQDKVRKKVELHALLVNGTNLGDSILSVINRESNNMLQGIVVVSDGRSTQFSTQTFEEVRARAAKSQVPIFAVGVGEYREPINLRITELSVPDATRPDDKFPIRVEVDGEGKAEQDVEVTIDVTPPEGKEPALKRSQVVKFKPGEPPHVQAEFQIDPADPELPPELVKKNPDTGKLELAEGKWKFTARVPKDKREIFEAKEHVSDPEFVTVVKKPLRVLLFASGPTRDYQFLRTLLVREMDQKRAEVSICLQNSHPTEVIQDVPAERMLQNFPNAIRDVNDPNEKPDDKYYNLMQYDLIVAFDPDWTRLEPEQAALLETWVQRHGGGLIVVGGPVNTFQLTRGVNQEKLRPVLFLYPVVLEDNHIQEIDRSTAEPWRLDFPGANPNMEFLKLDEEGKEVLSGWEEFFTGEKQPPAGGQNLPLKRGFYDYYPVAEVKSNALVVATFTDPRARMKNGKNQPYLVTMPYGSGKTVWIGSGEIWRLRQCHESFHERFWTKLCRFVASTSQGKDKSRGKIHMGKTFTANNFVRLEAHLLGRDMLPLGRNEKPVAKIKGPQGSAPLPPVELQPKPTQGGEWEGWFAGRFLVTAPGNYEIQLPVPGTSDTATSKFVVKESNPELDNTRPDFGQLWQIASKLEEEETREGRSQKFGVFHRITNDELRAKLRAELERTNAGLSKDGDLRLYFDLKAAPVIPDCMKAEQRIQRSRGPVKDLWDEGMEFGDPPLKLSFALLVVVALLSAEWLTRKLLKLA